MVHVLAACLAGPPSTWCWKLQLVVCCYYRRRCLRPIILLLDSTPCPPLPGLVYAATGAEKVPGGAALAAVDDDSDDESTSKAEGRWRTVAQTLVGEVVLATKEVGGINIVTRACRGWRGAVMGRSGDHVVAENGAEKVAEVGGALLAAADDDSDDEEGGTSKAEGRWLTVAQTLVVEVVLAIKEASEEFEWCDRA